MSPALLWLEHVMGFEQYWCIEFHTEDVKPGGTEGSGLRSKVFGTPNSGVKFANNEPKRPFSNAPRSTYSRKTIAAMAFNMWRLAFGTSSLALRAARKRGSLHANAGHLLRSLARSNPELGH